MTVDEANIPSVWTAGSIFAAYPPSIPEWRKVIRITGDPLSGYKAEVVKDYTLVNAVQKAIEQADSDDTPELQRLLMTAWQALAMYLASCDDEDKPGAMNALKAVSNLMSDGPNDGPSPEGTFGATVQTAATEYTCPKCKRDFATEQGLINHLATVHAQRETTPYRKNTPNQGQD